MAEIGAALGVSKQAVSKYFQKPNVKAVWEDISKANIDEAQDILRGSLSSVYEELMRIALEGQSETVRVNAAKTIIDVLGAKEPSRKEVKSEIAAAPISLIRNLLEEDSEEEKEETGREREEVEEESNPEGQSSPEGGPGAEKREGEEEREKRKGGDISCGEDCSPQAPTEDSLFSTLLHR